MPKKPIIICAANGYNYLDRGYAVLSGGGDTLDAVMEVITGPEDDPKDDSVGLGGLPNEEAWWNSTPAACMDQPGLQVPLPACATSRTSPCWRRP